MAGVGVYALTGYQGSARTAVLAYKERGRRDLAADLGAVFAAAIPAMDLRPGPLWLVPAPSGRRAAAARGGQHMRRVAHRCAAALASAGDAAGDCAGDAAGDAAGVPVTVAGALALRAGVRDSVGLDAAARTANLRAHLRVRRAALPDPGAITVLLDDVVTTGATAAACTAALRAAGVRVAAVLALTAAGYRLSLP